MAASLDIRFINPGTFTNGSLEATRGIIVAAFQAWTRHFDYTNGTYAINVTFDNAVAPADARLRGDTFVQVGTSAGTPVVETLFGLNLGGRNGTAPAMPPLMLSINPNTSTDNALPGSLEREFEHALGVRSFAGAAPASPPPAGTHSVYDGGVQGYVNGKPIFRQGSSGLLAQSYSGPNTRAGSPIFPFLSNGDASVLQVGAGLSVNNAFAAGATSGLQPIDVLMLRDAGVPALTDQELQEHQIARIYFGAFGRVATGAELAASYRYMQAALQFTPGGAAPIVASIAAALVSTPEFTNRSNALSNADYVRAVFQTTFDRAVDVATLGAITQFLDGPGQSVLGRGAVLFALTDTEEARGRLSANANVTYSGTIEAQVARMYVAAFGRAADPYGFRDFTTAVVNGSTLRQVAISFLASGEFAARYGAAASDQALVDGLYRTALGRAPDAAGKAQYLRALAAGALDRADLLTTFSESAEHIGLVAQHAEARDAAGLFLDTEPRLGIIPVLSGSKPYVVVSV